MKKRIITVIVAAVALLTLTAAPNATAGSLFDVSGSGVLVRHDDGYIITGTLRDADGQVVGTLHGTLTELTTGFNTCPIIGTASALCFPAFPPWACNLLGGDVTLNFHGTQYDASVNSDVIGHAASAFCKDRDDPTSYDRLVLFMWSFSHVTPGDFPDIFTLVAPTVQQISPTVWKWSS